MVEAGPGKENREEGGRSEGQEAERTFGMPHGGTARFKKGIGSLRRKQVPCCEVCKQGVGDHLEGMLWR